MDNGVVKIGKKEFNLLKKGREQAEQAIQIGRWITDYGLPITTKLSDDQGNIEVNDTFGMIGKILDGLSADALISLYMTILGCSPREAEQHFDIAELIEGLVFVWENQPAFRRLASRFFSQVPSEEPSETEPSTQSD